MIKVSSTVRMNFGAIRTLGKAQITALEQTAEALHTEVVQAQVMPFDIGNLQNESTFVDRSESGQGKVAIVHSTPYARRLYYHPEYHFQTHENPDAGGEWWKDWIPGGSRDKDAARIYRQLYRSATRGVVT